MPFRVKRQVHAGVFVQHGRLAQRLPGPAVAAHLHLDNAVFQRVHPQRHAAQIFVRRGAQPDVAGHGIKPDFRLQPRFCRVGVPVFFPVRFGGPQGFPVPLVQLPPRGTHFPAGSIFFRCRVFFMPQPPLGVVDQKPRLIAARHGQMQVIPGIQHPSHRAAHVHQPAVVQPAGDLGRQASVPGHHPVRRKVIQHFRQHAQAPAGLPGHTAALHAHQLIVRRAAAVELVQAVFLEKQHIPHAGGRTGERPVAAYVHGIAVRCNAVVGIPVGRVAQLAGIDHVLLAVAAPHTVRVLRHIFQLRHPPLGAQGSSRRLAVLRSVQARPQGLFGGHGKAPVIAGALGLRGAGQDNAVPVHLLNVYLSVQPLCQRGLHHVRQPGEGNVVPFAEPRFFQPRQFQLHVVHQQLRPLPAHGVKPFQHVHIGPLARGGVLFQEQLPVRRAFRLFHAHVAHGVGRTARVAGGNGHALALAPGRTQVFQLPAGRVKAHRVRPDQHPRSHADHDLPAVFHGVLQHGLLCGCGAVRLVAQVFPIAQQHPVQVVHAIALRHGTQHPPGGPGL